MPPIPNSAATWIGLVVLFFLIQVLSGFAGEVGKKFIRNKPQFDRRQNNGHPDWFTEFMKHHDDLVNELHGFTESLNHTVIAQNMTNAALEQHLKNYEHVQARFELLVSTVVKQHDMTLSLLGDLKRRDIVRG